jgi:hypothetical protein
MPEMHSNDLAVKLTLASQFPDHEMRLRIWKALESWCEDLEPMHSVGEVRGVLCSAVGTVLEPFTLTENDLRISCFFIRACFSKRLSCTRVRVVSRKSLGSVGGLVLTGALKSYYAEQFAFGKHSGRDVEPFIAPARMPRVLGVNGKGLGAMSARLVCDDSTFAFDVDAPLAFGLGRDHEAAITDIEVHSTMGGRSLRELGLAVQPIKDKGWRVMAKSAEAQIRMSAHVADASVVRLSPGPQAEFDYNLAFRMSSDIGRPSLCAAVVTPKFGMEFLSAMPIEGPVMSDDDVAKVLSVGLAQEGWVKHYVGGAVR